MTRHDTFPQIKYVWSVFESKDKDTFFQNMWVQNWTQGVVKLLKATQNIYELQNSIAE